METSPWFVEGMVGSYGMSYEDADCIDWSVRTCEDVNCIGTGVWGTCKDVNCVGTGVWGTCEDVDCIERERGDMWGCGLYWTGVEGHVRMWNVLNGSVGTCEDVDCIERERRDMWGCGLYWNGSVGTRKDVDCIKLVEDRIQQRVNRLTIFSSLKMGRFFWKTNNFCIQCS